MIKKNSQTWLLIVTEYQMFTQYEQDLEKDPIIKKCSYHTLQSGKNS